MKSLIPPNQLTQKRLKMRPKYTINDVIKYAEKREFILLENEYKGTKHKYTMKCPFGHLWNGTFEGLKEGKGCPDCSGSNGERLSKSILETMFEIPFPKKKPQWLFDLTGKRLELDGFNKDAKIAFEYQGVQHYKGYGIYEKIDIKERQKTDQLKADACKEYGIKLIVIPYFKRLNNLQQIIKSVENCIVKAGLKIPDNWNSRKANYSYYGYCPDLEEMRQIAIDKGGKCHSKYYLNARTLLHFECSKGHKFKIHANSVRNGNWCSQCGGSHPLNIDIVKELAIQRGEVCLSNTYINQGQKLTFRCFKNHQYDCTTKNYKKGRGCPECAKVNRQNSRRLGIEKMQEIALSFGGKCLSNIYINNRTKLKWQCQKGHIWSAVYGNVVEKGIWCPNCKKCI